MKQTFDLFAIDSAAEERVAEIRGAKSDPAAALVLNGDGASRNADIALAEARSRLAKLAAASSRRSR